MNMYWQMPIITGHSLGELTSFQYNTNICLSLGQDKYVRNGEDDIISLRGTYDRCFKMAKVKCLYMCMAQ